jgi:hypothetical protein
MKVYVNFPDPHFTIHHDPACGQIQKHHKPNQRHIAVTSGTLPNILTEFVQNKHPFAANPQENDLWLDISLATAKHEEAFVYVLQLILAGHYGSFQHAHIVDHQC